MAASTSKYFIVSDGNPIALCKICNKSIKCRLRGTSRDSSHLIQHLRWKHTDLLNSPPVKPAIPLNEYFENTSISTPISTPPKFNLQESAYPISSNNSNSTNEINFNVEDLKLIHPFSLIVSGPTSSGKSTLLFQILDNLHLNTTPVIEKVVYIYGIYQDIFKNYPNIFFTDNLDFMDSIPEVPTVIILDDLMSVLNNSKKLEELFTQGVHHKKVSVVLTLQNLFYHGGVMKTLCDNAMYIALTKHIQDVSKLDTFARQLESKNSNYFKESYADAISRKYGYLFCDLHPHSELRDGPLKIKYRSLIHNLEGQIIYLPKAQGMMKAVIQSGVLENPEQVKALVKSGPTLPDTFKSSVIQSTGSTHPLPVQECTESAMIPYLPTNPTQYTPPLQHNMALPASINSTSVPAMQAVPLHHPKLSIPHSTPTPVNLISSSNLSKSDDDTNTRLSELLSFFATYLAKPGSNPNTHANNYVVKPALVSPDIDTMRPTSLKNTKRLKAESVKPQKFSKASLEAAALAFPPYPSFKKLNTECVYKQKLF